jgi:hypothetical protein
VDHIDGRPSEVDLIDLPLQVIGQRALALDEDEVRRTLQRLVRHPAGVCMEQVERRALLIALIAPGAGEAVDDGDLVVGVAELRQPDFHVLAKQLVLCLVMGLEGRKFILRKLATRQSRAQTRQLTSSLQRRRARCLNSRRTPQRRRSARWLLARRPLTRCQDAGSSSKRSRAEIHRWSAGARRFRSGSP